MVEQGNPSQISRLSQVCWAQVDEDLEDDDQVPALDLKVYGSPCSEQRMVVTRLDGPT